MPFETGVVAGSDLPDSINVDRTAPVASGFAVRELGRGDLFVCSERLSLLTGLGVSGTGVLGVEGSSDSD